jgi:hypothetical protein
MARCYDATTTNNNTMTTLDTAFVIILAGALSILILASYLLNSTRWWLCPRCWHWHNDTAEKTEDVPVSGHIEMEPKFCQQCAPKGKL